MGWQWRRPVGRAGSGPDNHRTYRIEWWDYDPLSLDGIQVVGGRVLSPEWVAEMRANPLPPQPDFVQKMRETSERPLIFSPGDFVQQTRERKRHERS